MIATRSSRFALTIIIACALVCDCSSHTSSSTTQSSAAIVSQLSEAEMQYGESVTRSDKVTYQDDVVIVDHGADAIRSLSSDGLTWTIDANAPHAQELVPGKIMFLTSRAVGRILAVRSSGSELAITLGPVEITDVIKEAHLQATQPIDLSSMIAYSTSLPGNPFTPPRLSSQSALLRPLPTAALSSETWSSQTPLANGTQLAEVSFVQSDIAGLIAPALAQPPPLGPPASINVGDFSVTPFCCGGIGIRVSHEAGGLSLMAEAVVYLDSPQVAFRLDIDGGVIRTAGVELRGVAGLLMEFDAGSATGVSGNLSKEFDVPIDLSLPISGMAVPVAVTLHQTFVVKTGFSSRNSTLHAVGHYQFTGSIFMGYKDGSWTVGAPTTFKVVQSLPASISALSLGTTGFVMGYQAKVIVGIGAFGFVTGPYLGYGVGIGISNAAGVQPGFVGPPCHAADLDIDLHVGIGYSIRQPIVNAINFILRALNAKPIKSFGGLDHKETLIHKHSGTGVGCVHSPGA